MAVTMCSRSVQQILISWGAVLERHLQHDDLQRMARGLVNSRSPLDPGEIV